MEPETTEFRMGPIVRDVFIVFLLTFLGGFVAGFAHGPGDNSLAVAASNLIFGIVGFVVSGCLAPSNRWKHLAFVALGAWLLSFVNVLFFNLSVILWCASTVGMAAMMGIGGAISYLFKKDAS